MTSGSEAFWEGRYRVAAEQGASLWGAEPNGWIAEQVVRLAAPAGRAIDVGAGEGRNAFWLAERGWSVVAADFSTHAVSGMNDRVDGPSVEAVVADVTTWQAPASELAVLCYLQLEADALVSAIARAAEALTPGGVLLGIWHDREDLARGLGGAMSPAIRTTPDETAAAARSAGLVVDLSARRDRETPTGLACDCLLIARRP